MKARLLFFFSCVILLQACASGPDLSDPKVREAVARVNVYEAKDLKDKKFKIVKSVETKICTTNAASSANSSEEAAKTELRYLASEAGANGMTNYLCNSNGFDMGSNCWNSTKCYADAIILE